MGDVADEALGHVVQGRAGGRELENNGPDREGSETAMMPPMKPAEPDTPLRCERSTGTGRAPEAGMY